MVEKSIKEKGSDSAVDLLSSSAKPCLVTFWVVWVRFQFVASANALRYGADLARMALMRIEQRIDGDLASFTLMMSLAFCPSLRCVGLDCHAHISVILMRKRLRE